MTAISITILENNLRKNLREKLLSGNFSLLTEQAPNFDLLLPGRQPTSQPDPSILRQREIDSQLYGAKYVSDPMYTKRLPSNLLGQTSRFGLFKKAFSKEMGNTKSLSAIRLRKELANAQNERQRQRILKRIQGQGALFGTSNPLTKSLVKGAFTPTQGVAPGQGGALNAATALATGMIGGAVRAGAISLAGAAIRAAIRSKQAYKRTEGLRAREQVRTQEFNRARQVFNDPRTREQVVQKHAFLQGVPGATRIKSTPEVLADLQSARRSQTLSGKIQRLPLLRGIFKPGTPGPRI